MNARNCIALVVSGGLTLLMAACGGGSSTTTVPPPSTCELTVNTVNPSSGVAITVTPADNNSAVNGTTRFTRTYNSGTAVTLTAPATAGGNVFLSWSGCSTSSTVTCNVTMNASYAVTATYTAPAIYTLTVNSVYPSSGVVINASPADNNSTTSGTTGFTLSYNQGTAVTLIAPATAGGNSFSSWSGCASASTVTCNVTMNASYTVTTTYTTPVVYTLTNPGFAQGLTGWTNWGNTTVVSGQGAPSGYSACSGTGAGGIGQDISSQLTAGAVYTVTAYAMVLATGASTHLGIQFRNSSGNIFDYRDVSPNTTTFQPYSVTFTVPSGVSQAFIYDWIDAGTTELCVDNFSVQAVSMPTARNAYIQPFASNSIWNYPIGLGMGSLTLQGNGPHNGAQYGWSSGGGAVYEKLSSTALTSVYDDEDEDMWAPDATPRATYSNTIGWNSDPSTNTVRCNAHQTATGNYEPIPAAANYENNPGLYPNACTAILQSDRQTVHHNAPGVVCGVGGIFTSEFWDNNSNVFTDGTAGSHGSGLSEIGNEIRWFDLRPPQGGGGNSPFIEPTSGVGVGDVMRHAIGLNVGGLANNWANQTYWPATNSDGAREGLMVALLPTFNPNSLTTPIGRSMAWTLINYGGYILDQTSDGAWSVMGEWSYGPNTPSQLDFPPGRMETTTTSDWGYSFTTIPWGDASSTALGNDMITIWNNLYVVTNNSSTTISGDTSSGASTLQDFLPSPVDPGVMSEAPIIAAETLSVIHGATADGSVVGVVQAANAPYFWSLSGTGATLFNIDKWGVIRVAYGQIIPSSPSSYSLTVTGTNVIGQGSGTITINVN